MAFKWLKRVVEFFEDRADAIEELFTQPEPQKRTPKQRRKSTRRRKGWLSTVVDKVVDKVDDIIPPEPADTRPFAHLGIFDTPNTYPDHWSQAERNIFDTEPNTLRALYDQDEWDELQDAFYDGWLETGLSKEEHQAARERFYAVSGVVESSFDWEAWRRYIDTYVSPGVAA